MRRRASGEQPGQGPDGSATAGRPRLHHAWQVRLVRGALVALVLVGATAGPLALLAGSRPAAAQPVPTPLPSPVGAQGFAELYVAAYLGQASEDRPDAAAGFYPTQPDLHGVAAGQLYVARTATVDATLVGDRYWAVTVAVELLEAVKGAFRPLGTRYFAVGIRMDAGRFVATSLPAAVPAPPTARLPRLAVPTMAVPQPGDPVADTVSHFLAALLTGQGELDRYVDPASGLAAITPPPFAALRVRQLGQRTLGGHRSLVRVEAAAVDAAGHTTVLAYALELEQADGRWEVVRLDRAAPLLTATLPTGR